jgi:hypothetical protein
MLISEKIIPVTPNSSPNPYIMTGVSMIEVMAMRGTLDETSLREYSQYKIVAINTLAIKAIPAIKNV